LLEHTIKIKVSFIETGEECHWDLEEVLEINQCTKYRVMLALNSFRMEMKDKIQSSKNFQN
jgi:hypothetical protein